MDSDRFMLHIITVRRQQSIEMRIGLNIGRWGMNSDRASRARAATHIDMICELDAHGGYKMHPLRNILQKQFFSSL